MRSLLGSVPLMISLLWFTWSGAPVRQFATGQQPQPATTDTKPYGIDRRIPWTNSHVVGSPNPPLPYRVVQTFTKLKVAFPIAVAHEPGTKNLLLIHQHTAWSGAGRVLRIKDDPKVEQAEVLLSLDGIAYGLAFHPDYLKNGYLFVGWNGPLSVGKKFTRVTRYTVARQPPYALDPASAKLIIEWESDGHNGGDVAFGKDGLLYITSGDGTSDSDANLAGQDLSRLLSKVLRIDIAHPAPGKTYAIPADNPFLQTPGARPETWAYGFRNPWRIHSDRLTGDLWVGQNGQDLWEQLYLVQRGANYGWSVMEGGHPFYLHRKAGPTPISPPLADHPHSEMRSLTGGVVYRGSQLPELRGAYVYGDWSTGKIWGIRHEQGKVAWHRELADTTLQITGFGIDSTGELLIADHGSGYYRLEPTLVVQNPPKFPRRLSETGLFRSVKDHQPDAALIPYSVNAPLWSDGADKERFIALPGTSQMEFTPSGGWNFPEGAVLVKTFSLDTGKKTPTLRRIETRLLTRQVGKWVGYSYLWNDAQTDAELVGAAGLDREYVVRDPAAPDGLRKQTWHYPSRAECMVCHSRAANFVLGLNTLQMNKVHNYGSVADNQLRTLEHLGVFRVPLAEHIQEVKDRLRVLIAVVQRLLPKPVRQRWEAVESRLRDGANLTTLLVKRPEDYRRLVDPSDAHENLETRVRSYLHANCSICHVAAGGGNAALELDFLTERERTNLVNVRALHDTFSIPNAKLVVPGDPERSMLLLRLSRRGPGQMPPLASSQVDREAVQMVRDWIGQLK